MGLVTWNAQGRMGNWLWQAASIYAYCLEHGLEFSAPIYTGSHVWSPLYCPHLQSPKMTHPFYPDIHIVEKQFHYVPLPFEESWRRLNILFTGYFQAVPYIEKYRDEIIKAFNFKWELKPDICSIQARFGDYREIHGKHIIIDADYLVKAMKIVMDKTGIKRFKVFSDDLTYVRNTLGHIYDFEYSTNGNEVDDLVEISCCHSNICSSSTFAFWGAYLNQNPDKVVIFSTSWFQPGWRDEHGIVDTKDIICSEFIKI